MIAAEELNMIDSGEYVFFNIEIFGSIKKDPSPWLNVSDSDDRNQKAKKAYEALLTITTRKPENEEYQKFSDDVKLLAKEKYNYTFDETNKLQISQFVSAFHDAVLLFANALNESIRESGENALLKPLNGTRLTQLMWGREFKGITGNVSIDVNGDRLSDYSLLDMNPATNHFEMVANYFHKDGLKFVNNKTIHWAGGRTTPPADKPKCGFDGSLCPPEDSSTMFAILSLVLGLVVIVMAIVSFITYRHYRLEAEISSMTWKITWNEVIPLPTANQIRNSIHSRAGSQIVSFSENLNFVFEKWERINGFLKFEFFRTLKIR
jgi:atrial natriuretic peptide receptor A